MILRDDSLQVSSTNSAGQSFGAFNNSGITLRHSGTCNDGVGKGSSGGRIIVTNAGGGIPAGDGVTGAAVSDTCEDEGNVLVGNFALFGATGGELFVEGQAGDRFGVRNSGAVAVVEGVGDFCCEYMTNGSIINLGSYGKGFGNGMSGGTAYQYDPSGLIVERCSHDSVKATRLADGSELMQGQEMVLRLHLEQHLQATGSELTKQLLDNWQQSREHFFVLIPLALYSYHCGDQILAKSNRKAMVEELSHGWGLWHLRRLAEAYRHDNTMFDGQLPGYGDCDTDLICRYANAMGVLRRAREAAEKHELVKSGREDVETIARHLLVSEDRKLLEQLFKDVKEALCEYSDEALAALLADKRVRDYKESLSKREVWDTRAWGTAVWIMARDHDNHRELAEFPALEQALASVYANVLAEVMAVNAA